MKKTLSILGYPRIPVMLLFIVTAVLFKNCETPEEVNQVILARQWFENNKGTEWDAWPTVSKITSIDWTNAITNGKSIEVPVQLEGNVFGYVYDGKQSIKGKISVRLVLWLRDEGWEAVVFELVHVDGNIPRHLGDLDKSGFSGMIRVSYGAEQKYAALFHQGQQYIGTDESQTGRLQLEACLYFIYENSISDGQTTITWLTYELQYCYDVTAPQVPLPPDGGGWVLDYSGGGGGGGQTNWNPGFPTTPNDGDIYEIHEPSGKIVRYRYVNGVWEWDAITLPVAVITMYEYPFLFNVPTSLVVISDGIEYTFDEATSTWTGTHPVTICAQNFHFAVVTTHDLWQEAAISGGYVRLVYSGNVFVNLTINLPTLYFGMPYKNIEGQVVYSSNTAADIAEEVYNSAERDLVDYFKGNPYLTEGQYRNFWMHRMEHHMSALTYARGRVGSTGSINPINPVIPANFVPCIP